jgi:hypothetical protein
MMIMMIMMIMIINEVVVGANGNSSAESEAF